MSRTPEVLDQPVQLDRSYLGGARLLRAVPPHELPEPGSDRTYVTRPPGVTGSERAQCLMAKLGRLELIAY